ncbi:MAG: hypothetical protein JXD23_02040 [Spirochaetales bacterium]|nr:hypothetical protein [Spirochaetales bacterium]
MVIQRALFVFLFTCLFSAAFADGPDWLRTARIAGFGMHETIKDVDLDELLDGFAAQHVNVLECDTSLSDYLDVEGFEYQCEFIKRIVKRAHAHGLKVVWYYPTLECVTPDGEIKPHSMQKDHPEWVQRNFDRKTYNYFYGSKAFWVEPHDESAWLCPNTSFGDFYYKRLEKLAHTGLDGIWLDVPLRNTIVGEWTCSCPSCIAKFKAETGMEFPTAVDFHNPSFRRWIKWRHENLADFLEGAAKTVHRIDPKMRIIVEVVSTDHLINTREGLDATFFSDDLDIVWEVDAISDTTSMKDAKVEDWLCLFTAYRFCRGISRDRSSWAFSYGFADDDAQLAMASVLAAQCNPYETRIPEMCTSVGKKFRSTMFGWIEAYSDEIYHSRSKADIALLYSPSTRDLIDGDLDGGFYISEAPPSPAYRWWIKAPEMSLLYSNYMCEYRGWALMLIKDHVPFNVFSLNQMTAADLAPHRTLVLPRAVCLTTAQTELLLKYVARGGNLIVTGNDSGTFESIDKQLAQSQWRELRKNGAPSISHGKGRIVFLSELPGKDFLNRLYRERNPRIHPVLEETGITPWIDGRAEAYIQAYQLGKKTICQLVNFGWVSNKDKKAVPAKINLSIPWPHGQEVKSVIFTSPEKSGGRPVQFTQSGDAIQCEVEVLINGLLIIERK